MKCLALAACLVTVHVSTPTDLLGATPESPAREPRVTTVVASHEGGVGGLIADQLGYVYIADFDETVWRLIPHTGEIEAWATGLYGASGNTFDNNGRLVQASFYGDAILRFERSGEVTTIVEEGIDGPVGLVYNRAGELIVCSCHDNTVRKVSQSGHTSLFAESEHFACPNGVARDDQDNVYIVSFSNPKIIKITPSGETSVFADSGGRGLGHITRLRGIFYATSYWDNKVYRISPKGEVTVLAGTGERGQSDGPGRSAVFSNPNGIYPDHSGRYLYINDYPGDPNAMGQEITPFSVRRIEIPNLTLLVDHELKHGTVDSARQLYRRFLADPANSGEDHRVPMNALGWKYLNEQMWDQAIAVLELNAQTHADWWNAHSSLGAAYLQAGEKKKAITSLQRSLELNPKSSVAKERLRRLGMEP